MQHKKWYKYLLIMLIITGTACKKDQNAATPSAKETFIEKAKQYLAAKMPAEDFNKLDWNKTILYEKNDKYTRLKIPLIGNQVATDKAVYLKYDKDVFTGNYFSIDKPVAAAETITTLSLDNEYKCVVQLTAVQSVKSYQKYEHDRLIYDSQNGISPNTSIIRMVRAYINNAGQIYIWLSMLGADQGGSGDPLTQQQLDNMGALDYLSADPSFSNPSGGSNSTVLTIDYGYLESTLSLTTAQYDWLYDNPLEAAQIYEFLQSSTQAEKVEIAKEHVNQIITDNDYMNFVKNHTSTGNPFIVWWIDNPWLDNANNFNLDITRQPPQQAYKLTGEEKALTALFPVQAFEIKQNIAIAFSMSTTKMGAGTNNGLNDKKDAFRHAFFNAINTRDAPPRVFPVLLTASYIVRLFSNAHESETPQQLQMEKQMDVFNNDVGINYCWNCYNTSDDAIANAIKVKLDAGLLRYLSPLDNANHPPYNSNNPNCTSCSNGISPGITQLIPTNQ
jgi:hypothetical protein